MMVSNTRRTCALIGAPALGRRSGRATLSPVSPGAPGTRGRGRLAPALSLRHHANCSERHGCPAPLRGPHPQRPHLVHTLVSLCFRARTQLLSCLLLTPDHTSCCHTLNPQKPGGGTITRAQPVWGPDSVTFVTTITKR